MTLRLDDDDTAALRRVAEAENRSMQDVAQSAVRDYVASRDVPRRVRRSIESTLPAYRDLFTRLGQA